MKRKLTCLLFLLLIKINAQNGIKIGEKFADLYISDFIHNIPKDKNFENKYKVIEFWATWCGPCLQAVPHINSLQQDFSKRKDLVFLSMTYEEPSKVIKTLNKVDFKTVVVSDRTKNTHKKLGVEVNGNMILPKTYLLDNNNIIRWIGHPNELNSELINNLLSNKELDNKINKTEIAEIGKPKAVINQSNYQEILTDQSINKIFILSKSNEDNYRESRFNLFERNFIEFKTSLTELMSKLNRVPVNKIKVPSKYSTDDTFNLIYKNIPFEQELSLELLEIEFINIKNEITQTLNLKESKKNIDTIVYNIEVFDFNKLNSNKSSIESNMSKSGSSDLHYVYSNIEFNNFVNELSNNFRIHIELENEMKDRYDFLIKKGDFKVIEKELLDLGIKLKKSTKKIEYIIYE